MFNFYNPSALLKSFWVIIGMTCCVQAQVESIKFGDTILLETPKNSLPLEPLPAVNSMPVASSSNMDAGISGIINTCQQCGQSGCYGESFHLYAQPVEASVCQPQRIRPRLFLHAWQKDQKYFQYRFTPPCPGDSANQFFELQKSNGRLQQYVFYNFHFETMGDNQPESLTKSGIIKVSEITRIWPHTPGPIFLTPSDNPELDQQRHQIVFEALVSQGLPISPEYLVIAPRQGPGLMGIEAIQIFNQQLQGSPLNPVIGGQGSNSVFSVGSGNGSGSRPASR